jgi:protein O-mannosyl-transferase
VRDGFKLWPLSLLAVITTLCYLNSLNGSFVFDDQVIVFSSGITEPYTPENLLGSIIRPRAMLFFTYALNYSWSGLNTFSYHVVNVIIHVVNVLLVYGILTIAVRRFKPASVSSAAFAGALIFGVHTLFTSAVSYIAGRSSVLCATFYFAAILAFLKLLDAPDRRSRLDYGALTVVSAWFAWQTKQEAISLPLFLAGVLYLRSEKQNWRWIAAIAATPLVVAILIRDQLAVLFAGIAKNQELVAAGFGMVLAPATYFQTYFTAIVGYYLPRFIFPSGLSADPDIVPVEHWYSPEFLFSLLILSVLVWLVLHFRKTQPLFSLGVTALLVSPLMAYGAIPLPDVVLEHRAYIPGLGVAFLAAWLFLWLERDYPKYAWPGLAGLAIVFMVMTVNQHKVWANNIALWEDAVVHAPQKARPHFNLGQAYQDVGRYPEALQEYERTLALKPDLYAAYSNRAAILLNQGQMDRAHESLLKVTSLAPDFPEGFINLAVFYIRTREPEKALAALDRAIELAPDNFAAVFNRGEALTMRGNLKDALESYKEAVRLRPDLPAMRLGLGMAYWRSGNRASAEQEFEKLMNGPLAAEANRNMGAIETQAGYFDRAIEHLNRAVSLRNTYPEAHHDLGVAYLQKQMLDPAIQQFLTTLAQQPGYGPAILNLALAYERKGDPAAAKQTLEAFIQQYGNTNSPYITQARSRLGTSRQKQ